VCHVNRPPAGLGVSPLQGPPTLFQSAHAARPRSARSRLSGLAFYTIIAPLAPSILTPPPAPFSCPAHLLAAVRLFAGRFKSGEPTTGQSIRRVSEGWLGRLLGGVGMRCGVRGSVGGKLKG